MPFLSAASLSGMPSLGMGGLGGFSDILRNHDKATGQTSPLDTASSPIAALQNSPVMQQIQKSFGFSPTQSPTQQQTSTPPVTTTPSGSSGTPSGQSQLTLGGLAGLSQNHPLSNPMAPQNMMLQTILGGHGMLGAMNGFGALPWQQLFQSRNSGGDQGTIAGSWGRT